MSRLTLPLAVLVVLGLILVVAAMAAVNASNGVTPPTSVEIDVNHHKNSTTKKPTVKAPAYRAPSLAKRR
ncbi:hypothetical protein J7I94_19170 [Streptomyces sp. ISL-12]|uniref:hypothetical protein n=1 Tax=Streptomyces sp. ISL-12 TaxID=2819177 RepID=UPI001BE90511|nr:hypothetical protein [Streptomyces sp. ISL-12]MBT2412656.1 hypothetical protein [Streptomyces sp. ISL-12]